MFQNIIFSMIDQYLDFLDSIFLPCTVFCRNPLVLVAYDKDFTSNASAFLKAFSKSRAKSIHVFLLLGWEHETPQMAQPFAERIKTIKEQSGRLNITILTNSPNEVHVLSELGLHCVFCNQNAFVDETRFPILKKEKKYDAIYIARITPFKRHYLAKMIPSLHLIGGTSYRDDEKPYNEDILHNQLKHAKWTRHVKGKLIFAEIAEARCGLCLSQAEGAMFSSIEYLLCGIPVVSTKCLGGRIVFFPDFASKIVQDSPEEVAKAVQDFVNDPPDPERIRAAVLEKMNMHRQVLRKQLNEAMKPNVFPDSRAFPHKLLLRSIRNPFVFFRHGLLRRRGR